MRRFVVLLPCLLACAGNHASALSATTARAQSEAPATARDGGTIDARARARLTPPFHAAAASIRRLDTASADRASAYALSASDVASAAERHAAALAPVADARHAP